MDRRRIELIEHQGVEVHLDERELHALLGGSAGAIEVFPTMDPQTYRVKANSKVGMLAVGDLDVLVHPKIPLENVFVLIEPARVPLDLRAEIVGFGAYDEVTPAFAAFFARLLEHTLTRGMRRDYVAVEERLVALRGRVDLPAQARMPTATPLACRFEDHTLDTPHHRMLKAAALRLIRVPGIGDRNRDTLRHLLMWFGEVADDVPPVEAVLRRGFTRLDAYYEPVIRLAALILGRASLHESFGEVSANGFLIDMNKVFEAFVETRLREALAGTLDVRGQFTTHLDHDESVRMVPDLVFERRGSPMFAGDAKYKLAGGPFGVDADLYQLLAYVTALGVPAGVLVYADAGDARPPARVRVRGADKDLWAHHLDLSGRPDAIRATVAHLAEWIAGRVSGDEAHAA